MRLRIPRPGRLGSGCSVGGELGFFGGAGHGGGGGGAARDDFADEVEVAGADFALVAGGGVAEGLAGEFGLLHFGVGEHASVAVVVGEGEHAVVEGVEAGEGDELEFVAHGAELALEFADGEGVQLLGPVEGGGAVVGEPFAGEVAVDGFGEAAGLFEVGGGGFYPGGVGGGGGGGGA